MATPDLGTLTLQDGLATLTFVRRLPYRIERVWAAITDPEHRARWFGPTRIEARVGGSIETDPTDPQVPAESKHMAGHILVWDPPHVFEHEWQQRIVRDSVVRYELVADGDATILTFTHRGLAPRDARGFIPGTHAYLDRLAACVAGAEIPGWSTRYAEVAPSYA